MRTLIPPRMGVLASALWVCLGCGSALTVTTLSADGTYTREETLSDRSDQKKGFNSLFHFRAAQDGVTYEKRDGKQVSKLMVKRTGEAGAKGPIDLEVVARDGKALMSSQVSVTKNANGSLFYSEKLHWLGEPNSFDLQRYNQEQRIVRNGLPQSYKTQKVVVGLATAAPEWINSLLFGPPHPMALKLGPGEIDAASRLSVIDALSGMIDTHKQQWFPDISKDDEERLAGALFQMVSLFWPSPSADPASFDPLAYVVRPVGKVLETNGVQAEDGSVYWSLLPYATAKHDVTLTLLCKP